MLEVIGISLFLVLFVLGLFASIALFKNQKERLALSKKLLMGIPPLRALTAEEATSLKLLYSIEAKSGGVVHSIEGEHSTTELTLESGRRVTTAHYIGLVAVRMERHHDAAFDNVCSAEVYLPDSGDGTAYIISLNNKYSITEEAKARSIVTTQVPEESDLVGLSNTVSSRNLASESIQAQGYQYRRGRQISAQELYTLSMDLRFIPNIIIFISLYLCASRASAVSLGIGAVLCLGALVLIALPDYPLKKRKKNYLINVTGKLEQASHGVGYRIGRFDIVFPAAFKDKVSLGQVINIEGYPRDKSDYLLDVITLDSIHSVVNEPSQQSVRSRFILLSVLLFINLAVFVTSAGAAESLERTVYYYKTRGLESDLSRMEAAADYPFAVGQEVHFCAPATEIISEDKVYYYLWPTTEVAHSTHFKERVNQIKALQKTGGMIFLTSFTNYSSPAEQSKFLSLYYKQEGPKMADFQDYFQDSPAFAVLFELNNLYKGLGYNLSGSKEINYPRGGVLEEAFYGQAITQNVLDARVYWLLWRFFEEQAERLNSDIQEGLDQLAAAGSVVTVQANGSHEKRFALTEYDLSLFEPVGHSAITVNGHKTNFGVPIKPAGRLPAELIMNKFIRFLDDPVTNIELKGIITAKKEEQGQVPVLTIALNDNYQTVYSDMKRVGVMAVALLLLCYALGCIFYTKKGNGTPE